MRVASSKIDSKEINTIEKAIKEMINAKKSVNTNFHPLYSRAITSR